MPIYEYRCTACGFQKEFLLRMSDAPLTDCPDCKKSTFSKMVTAAGFQLKGSGWYATDFRGGNSQKPIEKQGDSAKGGDAAPAADASTKTPDKPVSSATESKAAASTATSAASAAPASSN